MNQIFNTHFGQGDAGTVAIENLETGKRKRPKGDQHFSIDGFLLRSKDERWSWAIE